MLLFRIQCPSLNRDLSYLKLVSVPLQGEERTITFELGSKPVDLAWQAFETKDLAVALLDLYFLALQVCEALLH